MTNAQRVSYRAFKDALAFSTNSVGNWTVEVTTPQPLYPQEPDGPHTFEVRLGSGEERTFLLEPYGCVARVLT